MVALSAQVTSSSAHHFARTRMLFQKPCYELQAKTSLPRQIRPVAVSILTYCTGLFWSAILCRASKVLFGTWHPRVAIYLTYHFTAQRCYCYQPQERKISDC